MGLTETHIHKQVAAYLNLLEGQGKLMWFHPANEGKRSVVAGAKLKQLGMKPGTPDIVILLPEDHVSLLELKSPKGKLSEAQVLFIERAQKFCPNCVVMRTFEEAKSYIDSLVRAFPVRRAA